jgi:H+/Cl- antiporter ClcA
VLIAAAVGLPAALVAAGFLALVHESEHWFWTTLPQHLGDSRPPWYLVLGLPVIGAGIVVVARRFLPGDGGHQPLLGLSTTPTPWTHGFGVILAALGTLVFGAVLGPEGPLIALGSAVGMVAVPFTHLQDREQAVISTAGSFSAISALFGGPLVAGMLLVEGGLGMGTALIPVLLPGLVAAAVGYTVFLGFGTWGGLHKTALTVPGLPVYKGTHVGDLAIAIVIGVAAALVIAVIRAVAIRVDAQRVRLPMSTLLLSGGFVVGVAALVARGLGANSQDVLFSGQSSIPTVVAEQSIKIVLVLLVAKGIGYIASLGSGFRGGPVFPAIFTGVALASVAEIVFNMSPTLAVAVGTAAGMASITRLLFAPILFSALLVGTNGVDTISATVVASVAAWIVTISLDRRLASSPPRAREAGP